MARPEGFEPPTTWFVAANGTARVFINQYLTTLVIFKNSLKLVQKASFILKTGANLVAFFLAYILVPYQLLTPSHFFLDSIFH
jgi:hypothetical protein